MQNISITNGNRKKIKSAAEEVGGLNELAHLTKIKRRTLYDYVSDSTEPKASALVLIAEATGRSVDWLTGFSGSNSEFEAILARKRELADFSFVSRFTVRASAGRGLTAVLEEQKADRLAFKSDWLRRLDINPQFCSLITAVGDSQEPTIPDGSLMLVDLTPDPEIRSGRLYILLVDDDLLVKRINRRSDGAIELLSGNPAYPIETLPAKHVDRLNVAGRVAWVGRTI